MRLSCGVWGGFWVACVCCFSGLLYCSIWIFHFFNIIAALLPGLFKKKILLRYSLCIGSEWFCQSATYDQNFSNTHIELGIIQGGVRSYGPSQKKQLCLSPSLGPCMCHRDQRRRAVKFQEKMAATSINRATTVACTRRRARAEGASCHQPRSSIP